MPLEKASGPCSPMFTDGTWKWGYGKVNTNIDEVELAYCPDEGPGPGPEQYLDIDVAEAKSPHQRWRKIVLLAAGIATSILSANTVFGTVAFFNFPTSKGVGDIFQADCAVVKRWNIPLHLLINILSTGLLAASNYIMQCLGSPTRNDVDKAHLKGASLDIRVPSVRNFHYLHFWRGFTWLALCLSTLPLHFFWNSTVFMTIAYNEGAIVTVNENFLSTTGSLHPDYTKCLTRHPEPANLISFIYDNYDAGHYDKISSNDCKQYAPFVSASGSAARRNIVAVQPYAINLTTTQCNYTDEMLIAYGKAELQQNELVLSWSNTEYCYIETRGLKECTLHYSSYLLYIVTICNAVKVIGMLVTAKMLWDNGGSIFATVGDATASFLENPDETTQDRCVVDDAHSALKASISGPTTTTYTRKPAARILKIAKFQWVASLTFSAASVITGLALYPLSETSAKSLDFPGLKSSDKLGFVRIVMVANSPQVILSSIYFLYNSLISAQCAALEWATYTDKRRPLRVTWPRGDQRSSYWLSLPYRYGIPLTGFLLAMYFLLSQTIDVANQRTSDPMGRLAGKGVDSVLMFNPNFMIAMCVMGMVLFQWQLLHGLTKFDNYIPYHNNSSAVISAMCHASDPSKLGKQYSQQELRDIASGPLMWGVTRGPVQFVLSVSDREMTIPGHCSFSLESVEKPVRGLRYQ